MHDTPVFQRPAGRPAARSLIALAAAACAALAPLAPAQTSIADDLRHANSLSRAFEHAAGQVETAVVHITTEAEIQRYRQDFLGRRFRVGPPELRQNGLGSGVIIDAGAGLVLTNHHVIKDGDRLIVRLDDGREVDAELIGSDEPTDLAVLRIEADDLVDAPFGDSDNLRVGEWVLALGSPFGFESTVTAGIVSAKGRSLDRDPSEPSYQEFIQTDAAINPGNSGGPLINLAGEIVGVNSAIISATRQSAGLGFAIPSAIAERVVASIVENGRVRRGYLGVEMRDLTPQQRREFGLRPDAGVAVGFVQDDTPAQQAGLEEGDIVLTINGREVVGGLNRLRNLISLTPPGETIEVGVLRGGATRTIRATVADITEIRAAQLDGVPVYELGVIVREMTRETSRRLGYRQHVPGLLVLDVQAGTPAAEAGIELGDILTEVDGFRTDEPDELQRAIENSLGGTIIELVRGRMRGTVEVDLD
jgi:Do/DeqQ family serine protease